MVNKSVYIGVAMVVVIVAVAIVLISIQGPSKGGKYGNKAGGVNPANITAVIRAGGSTWINPQMQVWITNFHKLYPGISITYDSVGSGAGVTRFLQGVYDIGAADVPMPTPLYENATREYGYIITIPDSIGAVAFIYNIPGFTGTLNLTADIIAGIYLGKIQYWDDPKITALNPGFKFPHERIIAVHRSDGSGTTYTLTLWLYKSSSLWRDSGVGYGYTVNWPVDQLGTGLGGKGSEGVTAYVKQNPWSIGYVELNYAIVNNLTVAAVQNPATGQFVKPSYETTVNALNAANTSALPSVLDNWNPYAGIFMNMNAPNAYPIVGGTYLHLRANYTDCSKAVAIYLFIRYILTQGQGELLTGYVPLPGSIAQKLLNEVGNDMTCNGKPVVEIIG